MGTVTLVSVETYLHTVYRPDRDYVEGEVLERNRGEIPHSWLQRFFIRLFAKQEEAWSLVAFPEVRVQVRPDRYRIPNVALLPMHFSDELIVRTPPVLCIEIFSSDDRMSRMRERVVDYKLMGVAAVWAVDPWRRVAYVADTEGCLVMEEKDLTVPGTPVQVTVEEIFAELDRLQERAGNRSSPAE